MTTPRIRRITTLISMDEWAIGLKEVNRPTPDSKGVHRYRTVQVIRDDAVADFETDLGDASLYGQEVVVPGGVIDDTTGRFFPVHTVGQLIDIAVKQRDYQHPTDHIVEAAPNMREAFFEHVDKKLNHKRQLFAVRG